MPTPNSATVSTKKDDGTGGQGEQGLGRSRGGFGTEVHVAVNGLGQPVEFIGTAGQASDIGQAAGLLAERAPEVVADRGYVSQALVAEVEGRGAEAVIPTQKNRKVPRAVDRHVYRERNVVERFGSKVKQDRRVATRYDKKAVNFLAFVKVAAIMVLLQ